MAIDFSLSPELEAIRLRIRTFINDEVKPNEERIRAEQIEAASPHPTKAQRDRNVSRGKSGGRRWFH